MRTFQPLLSETARSVLLGAIRLYQLTLSPFFGPCCRYTPTCSHYGAEAVRRFGAVRGGWLIILRILRCNPWGGAGEDPVPQRWPAPRHAASNRLGRMFGRRAITVERNR